MHLPLVFLTLFSIILITSMVTCFFCFIRSRRKEDEELMEQVHYQQQHQQHQQHQAGQQQHQTPRKQQFSQSPSNNMLINDQFKQPDYRQAPNAAAYQSSPYHGPGLNQAQASPQTEVRSDITQQINSAIIGSSEAEFQNDFIQVFPMYQIAPQPEKNTTPYLT